MNKLPLKIGLEGKLLSVIFRTKGLMLLFMQYECL